MFLGKRSNRDEQNDQRDKRARQRTAKNSLPTRIRKMRVRLMSCVPFGIGNRQDGADQYMQFILCKQMHWNPETLSPSAAIDKIWRAHILHTKHYRADLVLIALLADFFTARDTVRQEAVDYVPRIPEAESNTFEVKLARYQRRMRTRAFFDDITTDEPCGPFWRMPDDPTPFDVTVDFNDRDLEPLTITVSAAMSTVDVRKLVGDHVDLIPLHVHLRYVIAHKIGWVRGIMETLGSCGVRGPTNLLMVFETDSHHSFKQAWIDIQMLDGKMIPIFVDLADTVLTLKKRIERRGDTPVNKQRLLFCGKTLDNYNILAECNIRFGSKLQLALSLSIYARREEHLRWVEASASTQ